MVLYKSEKVWDILYQHAYPTEPPGRITRPLSSNALRSCHAKPSKNELLSFVPKRVLRSLFHNLHNRYYDYLDEVNFTKIHNIIHSRFLEHYLHCLPSSECRIISRNATLYTNGPSICPSHVHHRWIKMHSVLISFHWDIRASLLSEMRNIVLTN